MHFQGDSVIFFIPTMTVILSKTGLTNVDEYKPTEAFPAIHLAKPFTSCQLVSSRFYPKQENVFFNYREKSLNYVNCLPINASKVFAFY